MFSRFILTAVFLSSYILFILVADSGLLFAQGAVVEALDCNCRRSEGPSGPKENPVSNKCEIVECFNNNCIPGTSEACLVGKGDCDGNSFSTTLDPSECEREVDEPPVRTCECRAGITRGEIKLVGGRCVKTVCQPGCNTTNKECSDPDTKCDGWLQEFELADSSKCDSLESPDEPKKEKLTW